MYHSNGASESVQRDALDTLVVDRYDLVSSKGKYSRGFYVIKLYMYAKFSLKFHSRVNRAFDEVLFP